MSKDRAKRWYLVYAKPRQERVAQTNLCRQQYTTYLPLVRQPRRRRGERISVVTPMFPRYLFVQLDRHTDNWAPIRSTLGVVSIVRFGHVAAAVPDDFVALLRAREDAHGVQVMPVEDYKRGTRVRITDGGLMGYEAVFVARSSRDRVIVLLEILGKHTRASVDAGAIEPAN